MPSGPRPGLPLAVGPPMPQSPGTVATMIKVEWLIREANKLPEADRLRLLEAVERSLAGATTEVASRAGFAEDGRHG